MYNSIEPPYNGLVGTKEVMYAYDTIVINDSILNSNYYRRVKNFLNVHRFRDIKDKIVIYTDPEVENYPLFIINLGI